MKRGTFVLAVLCINSLAPGIARSQSLSERVEKELPSALDTYKAIHAAPELSHYEEKTAALMAKELRALGCDVFTGIGKSGSPCDGRGRLAADESIGLVGNANAKLLPTSR